MNNDGPEDTTATPTNTNSSASAASVAGVSRNTGNVNKKRNKRTMSDNNHSSNHGRKNGGGRNRGRGRGRGRGKSNNASNNKASELRRMSHALSWALRHSAQDIGLSIRGDGYVPVEEILKSNHPKLKKVFGGTGGTGDGKGGGAGNAAGSSNDIINDIRAVVETNDKQRFKLSYRPKALYYSDGSSETNDNHVNTNDEQILCIRANQGHSMDCINPELLLTKLTSEQILELPCIVHGTYFDKWTSHIQQEGLNKMTRNHVHFATGVPRPQQQRNQDGGGDSGDGGGDGDVISGIRKSCTVHIYLDIKKCAAAAATTTADNDKRVGERLDFYMSDNGVILTDGVNGTGAVPPNYFAYVVDVRTGEKIMG